MEDEVVEEVFVEAVDLVDVVLADCETEVVVETLEEVVEVDEVRLEAVVVVTAALVVDDEPVARVVVVDVTGIEVTVVDGLPHLPNETEQT